MFLAMKETLQRYTVMHAGISYRKAAIYYHIDSNPTFSDAASDKNSSQLYLMLPLPLLRRRRGNNKRLLTKSAAAHRKPRWAGGGACKQSADGLD